MEKEKKRLNPRKTFFKCGTCSQAMFCLINDEYGNSKPLEEKAVDILVGGIAQKGNQCGLLWGGSLAIGTESYRRFKDRDKAIALAIYGSGNMMTSFHKRKQTVNCRDISKVDWDNKFQFTIYILKTIAQGFVFNPCFNLISKWTPEAIAATNKSFETDVTFNTPCLSCASEVVKKMGGTEEESMMVAGFAGGIGLSGSACGALSAAMWYKMLDFSKNNNGKVQSIFNNPDAKKIIRNFYMVTDSEVECSTICNKRFDSIDDHYEYIKSGGCQKIIEILSKS
jgi:hypothetical protein